VQFYLDSNPFGSAVTSFPYTISWNTASSTDGSHALSALATDADANVATSSVATVIVDNTPPVEVSGSPSGTLAAGTTSAILSLTTNENATCRYANSSGVSYASMGNIFTTTGGTNQSSNISGLSNGTSYSYYVRCDDAFGNVDASDFTISFSVATPGSSPAPAPVTQTVGVAAGYNVGYPPGYIFLPTSTGGSASGITSAPGSTLTSSNASLEAAILQLQNEFHMLLSEYPFTRNLQLYDFGSDVKALQEFLIEASTGSAAQALARYGPTQYFGFLTLGALKEYQASVDVPATGYFGPLTRNSISAHP